LFAGVPQKAGVLLQLPFTEQQFPNVLPLQVAPLKRAPQRPSVEIGKAGCVVVVAVFELDVLLAVVVVELIVVLEDVEFDTGGGGT